MSRRRITVTLTFDIPGGQGNSAPYKKLRAAVLDHARLIEVLMDDTILEYAALDETKRDTLQAS